VVGELPPDICQLKKIFELLDGSIADSHEGEIIIGGVSKDRYAELHEVLEIGMPDL
jgi:hypothetical protein